MKVQTNTTEANEYVATNQACRCLCRAPDGTLWVAFVDYNHINGDILVDYSTDFGASWTEETAVSSARCKESRSLALVVDSNSIPMLIYDYDPASGDDEIRYVDRSGGSWGSPETVYTTGDTFTFPSACIDSSDNIHITFDDNTNQDILYVTGAKGSWGSAETVYGSGDSDYGLSISVDSSSEPYVVFTGTDYFYVNYRTGGAWQTPVRVNTSGTTCFWGSIAIDSADNLHAVYTETDGGTWAIYYKKRTGGAWGTEITVTEETATQTNLAPPILMLDTFDNVHIVYQGGEASTDETVYYKKITSGVLGSEVTLDEDILQPHTRVSTYSGLWHKYPSSGVLRIQPIVVLLHETASSNADIYFERFSASGEQAGVIAVVEERLHYVDAYGFERYVEGTLVG